MYIGLKHELMCVHVYIKVRGGPLVSAWGAFDIACVFVCVCVCVFASVYFELIALADIPLKW